MTRIAEKESAYNYGKRYVQTEPTYGKAGRLEDPAQLRDVAIL